MKPSLRKELLAEREEAIETATRTLKLILVGEYRAAVEICQHVAEAAQNADGLLQEIASQRRSQLRRGLKQRNGGAL